MVLSFKKWLIPLLLIFAFLVYYNMYRVAPGITLEELTFKNLDGSTFSKTELEGKTVFLNVMATWCGPCIAELPSIENAKKALEGENIEFLIVSDENLPLLQKFKQRFPYSYTYLQMQEKREKLGIRTIPTTYIFNSKGEVIFKKIGSIEWNAPKNIEMIKELIAEN
ncbi:MAG: TlpA disulfide reductase family protein [Chitinophagales bacterium]